jgi:hypothetical protein
MSFEKIGPYELTRSDLIAAALIISFSTGATGTRLKAWIYALAGLIFIAAGVAFRDPVLVGLGGFLTLVLFVLGPASRSRKRSKEIYLEYSLEGLVADTPNTRTTYKWSTIRTVKKVGSRLFIMISEGHALVISDRATSQQNMESLIATLDEHRRTSSV